MTLSDRRALVSYINGTARTDRMANTEWSLESKGRDMFVIFDGMRIAKLGRPGTPHARQFVLL